MTKKDRMTIFVLLLILASGSQAVADGGGGVFFGYQTFTYPFLSDYYSFASNSLGLGYFGGFGYGIVGTRTITGGFGMVILDTKASSGIAGGFGGIISGVRLLRRPLAISVVSFTGFGGLATGSYRPGGARGFFTISEELTLDIGIPLTPWFMPTVFAEYQIMGNLIPGRLFNSFFSCTPALGLRVMFGSG